MNARRTTHVRKPLIPQRTAPGSELPTRGASLRLTFRLARRMAQQAPGRSILIVFLIAIPIMGLVAFATIQASNIPTPSEIAHYQLGQMHARINVVSAPDPTLRQNPFDENGTQTETDANGDPKNVAKGARPLDPSAWLPASMKLVPLRTVSVVVAKGSGSAYLAAVEGNSWDSKFAGKFDVVAGRRPTNDSEIMASAGAMTRLGAQIGSSVNVTSPRSGTFTIVGELSAADLPTSGQELFGKTAVFDGVQPHSDLEGTSFYVPETPISPSQLTRFNEHGETVLSRDILLDPSLSADAVNREFGGSADSGAQLNGGVFLLYGFVFGGFGLFEVVLLAGAAFSVGARQQQRALATLASIGGDRRTLFRVVSFGGLVLGAIGGVVGCVIGVLGCSAYMTISAAGQADRYPGLHLDWGSMTLVVAFSIVAGWIAAALPARAASRSNVIAALRGAVRPPRPRKRTPIIGVVVGIIGAAIALTGGVLLAISPYPHDNTPLASFGLWTLIAGSIILQVGVAMIAPLVLRAAATLLSRGGAGARLGSRDAARNPGRAVPAVAAIMSTVFVAVFIMCILASSQIATARAYVYSAPLHTVSIIGGFTDVTGKSPEAAAQQAKTIVDRDLGTHSTIVTSAPGNVSDNRQATTSSAKVTSYPVPLEAKDSACPSPRLTRSQDARCPTPSFIDSSVSTNGLAIWIGSAADFTALTGMKPTAESARTLTAGGAVSFYPQFVSNDRMTIGWKSKEDDGTFSHDTLPNVRTETLPARVQQAPKGSDFGFGIFISTATARSLGIPAVPNAVVAHLHAAPTQDQHDSLRSDLDTTSGSVFYAADEEGPPASAAAWEWVLLGLCALIAVASAAIAIALARVDGRRDDSILYSIGSAPSSRRSFGFWQAIVIVGSGTIIGTALALVPSYALSFQSGEVGSGQPLPFSPPWLQLVIVAFALPVLIAAGSWLVSRRARFAGATRAPIG